MSSSKERLDGSTHWQDCWREHHRCAVAEVERLARELAEARDLIAHAMGDGDEVVRRLTRERDEWRRLQRKAARALESRIRECDRLRGDCQFQLDKADSVVTLNSALEAERDRLRVEVERLTRELAGARELLKKCVTTGYSRHEINCFLAGQSSPGETTAERPAGSWVTPRQFADEVARRYELGRPLEDAVVQTFEHFGGGESR